MSTNATSRFAEARLRCAQHLRERALAAVEAGDEDGAVRSVQRSCRAVRDRVDHHLGLAVACLRLGAPRAAIEAARAATEAAPRYATAWLLLADACRRCHRHADALTAYEQAEAAGHAEVDSFIGHAATLQALQRPLDAVGKLLKAAVAMPHHAGVHAALATAFRDLGLVEEAVESLRTLRALAPGSLQGRSAESFEKRHLFDWSDLGDDLAEIGHLLAEADVAQPSSVTSFALLSLPLSPDLQTKAAALDSAAVALGVKPLDPVDRASRAGRREIHVGWLSADFREHPVAQLLVEVIERWPAGTVRHTLYAHGPDDGSPMRRRLKATAHTWVDLEGLSDREAAARIRSDEVDVLIDLQGHTRLHRLPILAHRPAPLQAAYLGFPGSTGATFIDYLIGDPYVTPIDLADLYTEKLAQLPLCFQPNGRWRPVPRPMSRAEAGLPDDAFVMCAFNHTYKILPEAFDVWCRILRDEPSAVLWLKETNGQLHAHARRHAAARGVDPARILFAGRLAFDRHFDRLALADVFVDTWPYNAHTTAADALWAGVPVVTVYGNGFASRVAASVLNAVGLPELAFADETGYEAAIRALAGDPALRAELRSHLQAQRLSAPLFDPLLRARELEALLCRMVDRWRAGLEPEHLPARADPDPGPASGGHEPVAGREAAVAA